MITRKKATEKIPKFEDFKKEYDEYVKKTLDSIKNRFDGRNTIYKRFDLSDEQFKEFIDGPDFEWWLILLGAFGSVHKDLYYKDGKLIDTVLRIKEEEHCSSMDDFIDYISSKYSKSKRTYQAPVRLDKVEIIEIDTNRIKIRDIPENFFKKSLKDLDAVEIERIKNKTTCFVKYFSGLFERETGAPYILKSVERGNFELDIELIKILRIVETNITTKRFKEICCNYLRSKIRQEFSITEMIDNWSHFV